MKNPCHGCTERVIPTKDDPRTCHGHCEREAKFQAFNNGQLQWKQAREKEGREVKAVWSGKAKRVHRKRES